MTHFLTEGREKAMADLKMPDINSVMIAGNLTTAPSFRKTTNGTPVANFYIASNRRFKDNTGQWRENVCYVGVVAWYKLAESCAENLHKGSAVLVDGELQSRIWKNEDGTTKNVVEIKARRIQFLNKRLPSGEMVADGEDMDSVALDDNHAPPLEEAPAPEAGKTGSAKEFSFGYENLKL
jgi:single-strand DNA-binding protein